MKTVYLAGKITGEADYKEKFGKAEKHLKNLGGYAVLNPAILPPEGFGYDSYIRISEAMLKECQAACFIKGWADSAGARGELRLAKSMGKEILYFDGERVTQGTGD